MNWLNTLTGGLLWQPKGCLNSLSDVFASSDVARFWEWETLPANVRAPGHPLLVVEFLGGKVIGDLRLVATRENVVIGGLQSIFGCADPANHFALRHRRLRRPRHYPGTAWLLGTPNGDNYYHWLLDILPRWRLLSVAPMGDCHHVLLPAHTTPFQTETLARLGVPAGKHLRCRKAFVHQFDRLVVPAMPFPVEEVAPWACAFVRSLFPTPGSGAAKLYLVRGPGRRRLVNEPALERALSGRGFACVQTGGLSVAQQARLLGSARFVVAPHGAALTNLIFAPAGATLLELFHPAHKNRCYVNLAAACGHHYLALDGRAVPTTARKDLAYEVEVEAVLRAIRAFA